MLFPRKVNCISNPVITVLKPNISGFSECLKLELSAFNIRVLTVAPGTFCTPAVSRRNLRISPNSINDDGPYTTLFKLLDSFPDQHGSEPGDPDKLTARVMDLVKREGVFEGVESTELPNDLFMGRDAWEEAREKCMQVVKNLDRWKGVSCSTDFDRVRSNEQGTSTQT